MRKVAFDRNSKKLLIKKKKNEKRGRVRKRKKEGSEIKDYIPTVS